MRFSPNSFFTMMMKASIVVDVDVTIPRVFALSLTYVAFRPFAHSPIRPFARSPTSPCPPYPPPYSSLFAHSPTRPGENNRYYNRYDTKDISYCVNEDFKWEKVADQMKAEMRYSAERVRNGGQSLKERRCEREGE